MVTDKSDNYRKIASLRVEEPRYLDYLLKPVDDERFDSAVQRARYVGDSESKVRMAERVLEMLRQNSASYVSRFPVRVGSRIQLVFTQDIEWVGGAGNYAELHSPGWCHLLRKTLNSLEQKLDPWQFLRIHRSRIVRVGCIRELQPIIVRRLGTPLQPNLCGPSGELAGLREILTTAAVQV